MSEFHLFNKEKINTPGFFLSTIVICALEVFTHINTGWPLWLSMIYILNGLILLYQEVPSLYNYVKNIPKSSEWYDRKYKIVGACSFIATVIATCMTKNHEILYLPLFVGLCFHAHANITRNKFNHNLGTILIIGALLGAMRRYFITGELINPFHFVTAYCLVIFASLLIKSLHMAHIHNESIIKNRSEAIQSIHELLLSAATSEIYSHITNIKHITSDIYLGYDNSSKVPINHQLQKIEKMLTDIKLESRTSTPMQEIVSTVLHMPYSVKFRSDVYGMGNTTIKMYHRVFIVMMLHNLIETTCQHSTETNTALLIKIRIGDMGLIIEDNVIASPTYNKFLTIITDISIQNLFGYELTIDNIAIGTRYTLIFPVDAPTTLKGRGF